MIQQTFQSVNDISIYRDTWLRDQTTQVDLARTVQDKQIKTLTQQLQTLTQQYQGRQRNQLVMEIAAITTAIENTATQNAHIAEQFRVFISRQVCIDRLYMCLLNRNEYTHIAKVNHRSQRQDLLTECKSVIEGIFDPPSLQQVNCPLCNIEMHFDAFNFELVCEDCGVSQYSWYFTNQTTAFGGELGMTETTYKRKNHLRERLMYAQGKEPRVVSNEILLRITHQLILDGVRSENDISHIEIRNALRTLELTRLYKSTQQITYKVKGETPLQMSEEEETVYIANFMKMQKPFEIHSPAKRTQFLSYSLTLHFLSIVQNMEKYAHIFPELKGDVKLRGQIEVLKKISIDLNWLAIPAVRAYIDGILGVEVPVSHI